jgi:hypothetical protein
MSSKEGKTAFSIFISFITKTISALLLILCTLFLIINVKSLYFTKKANATNNSIDKMIVTVDKKLLNEHFHNIDESIYSNGSEHDLCFDCHGILPHDKSTQVRSFLNMHMKFISCEVCHLEKNKDDIINFIWIDTKTDERVYSLTGSHGNYSAKIAAIKKDDKGDEIRLYKAHENAVIKKLIKKLKGNVTLEKLGQLKNAIHKDYAQKPLVCTDCHSAKGYLNFIDLNYSEKRAAQLRATEAAGMVEKYKGKFFFPDMLNPDKSSKRKIK